MINDRFYRFVMLIDRVHKVVHKLRFDTAPYFGVKSVHIFWIYELCAAPEGLTAAELASKSMISRSLVSRELEMLLADGYVEMQESARGKRKNYNSRITLTQKGKELADYIASEGIKVRHAVDVGIDEEELSAFYVTLEKIYQNLCVVAKEREGDSSAETNTFDTMGENK